MITQHPQPEAPERALLTDNPPRDHGLGIGWIVFGSLALIAIGAIAIAALAHARIGWSPRAHR